MSQKVIAALPIWLGCLLISNFLLMNQNIDESQYFIIVDFIHIFILIILTFLDLIRHYISDISEDVYWVAFYILLSFTIWWLFDHFDC